MTHKKKPRPKGSLTGAEAASFEKAPAQGGRAGDIAVYRIGVPALQKVPHAGVFRENDERRAEK
jgi:hypothetical protein